MKVRKYNNGGPINSQVTSKTSTRTKSKKKSGKEKVKVVFKQDSTVKDLDTGGSSEQKTKSVSRQGQEKRYKATFKIKDKDDKLLVKQVDKKGGSRLRVTNRGKAKYGK